MVDGGLPGGVRVVTCGLGARTGGTVFSYVHWKLTGRTNPGPVDI